MPSCISQDCCCQCPCPVAGHCQWMPLQETLKHSKSGSLSCGVTVPLPWALVHTRFACALQEWSLCFPKSCGSPVIKSYWPSKSDSQRILNPFCRIPSLRSLMWGLEPSTVGELLWCYFSSVCGSPTWQV